MQVGVQDVTHGFPQRPSGSPSVPPVASPGRRHKRARQLKGHARRLPGAEALGRLGSEFQRHVGRARANVLVAAAFSDPAHGAQGNGVLQAGLPHALVPSQGGLRHLHDAHQ